MSFTDPHAVAAYPDKPPRMVPGYHAIHTMAGVLIAERVSADARVLVLGAGGGLETKALATAYPGWTFDGVDPSAEMLSLAESTLGPLARRVRLHEGYAHDAPDGPFDAATSLLTLHFLPGPDRLRAAAEIRRRLKPGAPLVVCHASLPARADREQWLSRYAAFAVASGVDAALAGQGRTALATELPLLDADRDAAILRDAGFSDVTEFYAAFAFRGWVAYA
jgi:tRNA (cmo5U34)-methyltransferase